MRIVILILASIHSILSQYSQTSRTTSQPQPQCQCITPPAGPLPCLPYDSRFQAATLEEAMLSFPDLTINQEEPGQASTIEEEMNCTTQACLDCRDDMRRKLHEVGLMNATITEILQSTNFTSTCQKYRFARKDKGMHNRGAPVENSDEDDDDDSDSSDEKMRWRKRWRHGRRQKRQIVQANSSTQNIVGERFVLSCTTKGVTPDVTGTVALCSACWVWRRLPDNYSPQYINELLCDTDTNCLSGYAGCQLGHRTIEVVRNDTGVMRSVALTAGSYCECRATANSAIQTLVDGSGLPSLPAVGTSAAPSLSSSAIPPVTSGAQRIL
ncbi:unnamed protein product [Cylicocyclus nassatus]|uniref:Uncharacterized protein n=1 Tax=Cylicocyclus nassatus TaxID=53992 RepID=A0AA36M506_CYLNA|nr:unnamed protein product [Cylicocyclus nassatus]